MTKRAKPFNKYIDHTLLKPEASESDIRKLCREAKKYNFATVFVNPSYIPLVRRLLNNSNTKVGVAIGFPLGATTTNTKVLETVEAINNGADEVDMVMNIGALKSKKYDLVERDIESVVIAARPIPVKVIIETGLLTREEKVKACQIATKAGAKFVKTSTGFVSGATVEDVKLLKKCVGKRVKVKASGGIRDYETVRALIKAGASRIGTSSGVKIMEEITRKAMKPRIYEPKEVGWKR